MISFWKDKRVLITGHTGFKGSWLILLLQQLGAKVGGISIDVPTNPSMYELCHLSSDLEYDLRLNINDAKSIELALVKYQPEIVFHMAAQSLVRKSYVDPIGTYQTNVMGTLNVLMAALKVKNLKVLINITTDKCYENKEKDLAYKESDPLGGFDPYSSSKACSEILSSSIRQSFYSNSTVSLATARAGNVIGGGDWATDRIVPDLLTARDKNEALELRYPNAIRPWQHVLEPLFGYITLAQACYENTSYSEAWNFGPNKSESCSVMKLSKEFTSLIPNHPGIKLNENGAQFHEAHFLMLDSSKAHEKLKWKSKLTTLKAIQMTAHWYIAFDSLQDMKKITLDQIKEYLELE